MKPIEEAIYKWIDGQAGKDLSILSLVPLLSSMTTPMYLVAIEAKFPSTDWNTRVRFLLCWSEKEDPTRWLVTTIPDLWLMRYVGQAITRYSETDEE